MSFSNWFELAAIAGVVLAPFLIAWLFWGPEQVFTRFRAGDGEAREGVINGIIQFTLGDYIGSVLSS